ncbi:MAG TPA: hypothetical protein VKP66_19960 [Steroidobacteraceae bacterium]|nr:hypothetical protein [Steroidobacteraceae bacterium]
MSSKLGVVGSMAALAAMSPCRPVLADVTIQEQTTIHAFVVKAHGTTTHQVSGDKERSEVQFACDGVMSMFCGHNKTVDIVRLDRDVTWDMDAKKKRYTETPFPTPEQQRAFLQHQQAVIDKLKSCPAAQPAQSSIDTSKCEMSPPVLAVTKTQDSATLVGHTAQRTNVAMTQSCKLKDTGDVCQFSYSFDVWLTQDDLPGLSDRKTFQNDYQRKLGLTGATPVGAEQLSPLLAPYADSLKQLKAKSADFKGYPLKTTFRFAAGGAHCGLVPGGGASSGSGADGTLQNAGAAAGDAGKSSATNAAGWGTSAAVQQATGSGLGGYVAGSAAGAFAHNMVSGLFSKKKSPDAAAAQAAPAAQPGAADGLTTVAEITMETTAIDPAAISPEQFEVPASWQKITPKAQVDEALPNCPGG